MSAFVISLKENGQLKYTYNSRRGKTILTSMEYSSKEAIHGTINFLKNNFEIVSLYKFRTPSGKYFFKIAIEQNIYATSRKFTTELRLIKGMDEVRRNFVTSEILDFSVDIFASAEDVFGKEE
ncbi:hypothetical protein [Flavobacterium sp. HSC-61S13]|uniref:hypothetical protein n=1 Tax=Flavobacterium sp. HSC-61S13 TaxID=2910963 RepID=UPI00209E5BE0|nr:hypothetical protein [Flavobacterium sp. HSC-61S13]MCP1997547.1 uncharacterized protein YegP (UPF0339 family) [Flavobacterium sp. HSC-61S13]